MSVVLFPNTWWLMPGLYGVVGFIILTQLVWSFYNKHWSFTAMLGTLFLVVSLLFIVSLAMAGQPTNTCSPNAYFIASLGVSASIVFANVGAAYGTAKAGIGIAGIGVMRSDLVMRSLIPVVMAGVLGIYGLITSVIINGKLDKPDTLSLYSGYALLGAGLTVGLSAAAAGFAIGVVGDAGTRCNALANGKLFVGLILILIFAEALGLYGLIVGLVVASGATDKGAGLCTSYNLHQ